MEIGEVFTSNLFARPFYPECQAEILLDGA